MDFTTDKLRSLVRKWQTLIEAHVDVKTTDNYTLRMFCIGFTKRREYQVKRTCYAQSSQIRQVSMGIQYNLSSYDIQLLYVLLRDAQRSNFSSLFCPAVSIRFAVR